MDSINRMTNDQLRDLTDRGIRQASEYGIKHMEDVTEYISLLIEHGELDRQKNAQAILKDSSLDGTTKISKLKSILLS